MTVKIRPVILAGGSGTRLWPLSRAKSPKQFIPLVSSRSLFQEACLRFSNENLFEKPVVITHEEYRFLVLEQLKEIGIKNADIVIEPSTKNTASASSVAAALTEKMYGISPLLITPADHVTEKNEELLDSILAGLPYVLKGNIVVFGIQPTHPHPGYGYLIKGKRISEKVYASLLFVEKPTQEKARELIENDGALWNSGIYFATNVTLLKEIQIHEKKLFSIVKKISENFKKVYDYISIDRSLYEQVKNISIDKAIGERSDKVIIVESEVSWSDLGSWSSLHKQFKKNENRTILRGDVIALNTEDSYIESTSRLVAAYGLKGVGVIETKDAVAVFPLNESNNIRLLVEELDKVHREETLFHKSVKRPWGEYEILDRGATYQLKRLTVYPGGSSSLQRHSKRSEHWLVVAGTASVTKDSDFFELHQNGTVYIPVGSLHKIENRTDTPVTIIETQTGSYFGEDDIERLDDKYGRV